MIDTFEWTGAIIITGAIVLLCVLFGALFRPLDAKSNSAAAVIADTPNDDDQEDVDEDVEKQLGAADKVDHDKILDEEGSDSLGILPPPIEMNGNHKFPGKPVS